MSIDQPGKNDNRNYNYEGHEFGVRAEYPVIAEWIKPGSKVIDLACGNGSLMKYLRDKKPLAELEGIEVVPSGVQFAQKNQFNVRLGEIDKDQTYESYRDSQFDYAVCNVSLQMVMYPEVVVRQMKRIARRQIISFPNFAYIFNRWDLLAHGRMPLPMMFGYKWYNTGHIHHLSVRDFKDICRENGLQIINQQHLSPFRSLADHWPNLLSVVSIFLCEKH